MTMPPRPSFMERSIKRLNRAVSEVNKHQKQHDTSLELLSDIIHKHDGSIDKIAKMMDDMSNGFQTTVSQIHVDVQGDTQIVRKQLDDILIMVVDVYKKVYRLGEEDKNALEGVVENRVCVENSVQTEDDVCNKLEAMFDKVSECAETVEHFQTDIDTITREIARLRDIQDAILNASTTTYELLESVKIAQNKMVYDFDSFKDGVEHFHQHILGDYINKHMDDLHKAFDTKMDSMLNVVCKDQNKGKVTSKKRVLRGCCMQ